MYTIVNEGQKTVSLDGGYGQRDRKVKKSRRSFAVSPDGNRVRISTVYGDGDREITPNADFEIRAALGMAASLPIEPDMRHLLLKGATNGGTGGEWYVEEVRWGMDGTPQTRENFLCKNTGIRPQIVRIPK